MGPLVLTGNCWPWFLGVEKTFKKRASVWVLGSYNPVTNNLRTFLKSLKYVEWSSKWTQVTVRNQTVPVLHKIWKKQTHKTRLSTSWKTCWKIKLDKHFETKLESKILEKKSCATKTNEPRKKPSYFPLYWLVNRDPYNGLIIIVPI